MMTLTVEYYFTHPQDKLGMYASDPEDNSQEHGHILWWLHRNFRQKN